MQYVIILGATGSVGKQAIEVIDEHNKKSKNKIKIVGLANLGNKDRLIKLAKERDVDDIYCKADSSDDLDNFIAKIKSKYNSSPISALNAIAGFSGLEASLLLAKYNITTLLANKESIVAGGNIYLDYAKSQGVKVVPVDSEHSAIYSLVRSHKNIKNVIITASGGPFRDLKAIEKENITPSQASLHPNWKMGTKISIDSATLANKVMEVVEAKYLFNLQRNQIKVVINRESVVHSLVELKNNSLFAELSVPDMKLPLSKALGLRSENFIKQLDFSSLSLNFSKASEKQFEFLSLIDIVCDNLRNSIIFNAADEIAVQGFRDGKIKFTNIFKIVECALNNADEISNNKNIKDIDEIYRVDEKARKFTSSLV